MSRWFRHYVGICQEKKLIRISAQTGIQIQDVVFVWTWILESACEREDSGTFVAGADEIAFMMRCDPLHVQTILDAIEAVGMTQAGVVKKWVDRQYESDSSKARVADYRARKKAAASGADNGCNVGEPLHVTDVTPKPLHVTVPDTDTDTEPEKKRVLSNSLKARDEQLVSDFERFWDVYPRRAGNNRKTAFERFKRAVNGGAEAAAIIAGARAYATYMADKDRQFVKQVDSWLFQQKWLADWTMPSPNIRGSPVRKPTMADIATSDLPSRFGDERPNNTTKPSPNAADPPRQGFVGFLPFEDRADGNGKVIDLQVAGAKR